MCDLELIPLRSTLITSLETQYNQTQLLYVHFTLCIMWSSHRCNIVFLDIDGVLLPFSSTAEGSTDDDKECLVQEDIGRSSNNNPTIHTDDNDDDSNDADNDDTTAANPSPPFPTNQQQETNPTPNSWSTTTSEPSSLSSSSSSSLFPSSTLNALTYLMQQLQETTTTTKTPRTTTTAMDDATTTTTTTTPFRTEPWPTYWVLSSTWRVQPHAIALIEQALQTHGQQQEQAQERPSCLQSTTAWKDFAFDDVTNPLLHSERQYEIYDWLHTHYPQSFCLAASSSSFDSHSHSTDPFQPHNNNNHNNNKRRGTKKGKPPSMGRMNHPSKHQPQQVPRTNQPLHTNTPTKINNNQHHHQGPCWIALDDEDLIHGTANERYRSLFEQDHVVPVQSSVGFTLANARQALTLLRRQQQRQHPQHNPLDPHSTTSTTSYPHRP